MGENIGWSVIPLFDAGTILSGYYQLPVYANIPPLGFVADCATEEAEKILEDCIKNPKSKTGKSYQKDIKLASGYPQILIKIIDSLMLDMEDNLLGTLVPIYLPPTKEAKYKFDKNVLLKDAKSEPLSKRIQKGNKANDCQKKINELFVEKTKINHYDLEEISQMKDDDG